MNRDELESRFENAGHSVMDWCAAHPKATAVIVALVVGIIAGVVLF